MSTPLLWQYNFSNYNEKARWALDYKRIPHKRRSLLPSSPRALAFSARGTLPVLDLDGERIVDSTAIIAALERHNPEPALYPSDPEERRSALELEDYFDEEVGHAVREVGFLGNKDHPDYLNAYITTGQGPVTRAAMRALFPIGWLYVKRRYKWSDPDLEAARDKVAAGLDRIEAEAGDGYLVGDSFTVADLTAASLLFVLAWPPELQYHYPDPPIPELLKPLLEHPAVGWVTEIYRRHRGASAEVA